jgi:hypothetical protein
MIDRTVGPMLLMIQAMVGEGEKLFREGEVNVRRGRGLLLDKTLVKRLYLRHRKIRTLFFFHENEFVLFLAQ